MGIQKQNFYGIFFLILIFTLSLLLFPNTSFSQVTKIMGHVTDASTNEPIPFTYIILKGTTTGTITDFDGKYAIETKVVGDSITARILGYRSISKKLIREQFQVINFELYPESLNLPEIVVKYKGNPADVIMDSLIANKKKNSRPPYNTYEYDAYTKIEVDANNISEKLKNRKILKPFEFVWSYIDTSTINGKSYLPVFITETMSEVSFRNSPRSRKEDIKASKVSGLENTSVTQFLGKFSEEVNVYGNFIVLLEKNFVSPASDNGHAYYNYYLIDSTFLDNNWCYHIMFKPKRKQELTFTGSLWVNDTTWAVKKLDMHIASDANLNFINELGVKQEYSLKGDHLWMLNKDVLFADFNIVTNTKKLIGFYAVKTVSSRNFRFDIPPDDKIFSRPSNIFVTPGAETKTNEYWDTTRFERLSPTEKGIYTMVDSVKNLPVFKTYVDVIYGITTGYLSWGKFEIGPYFKLYSFNKVEGSRVRLGARTANSLSKKIQLEGYVAYGFTDMTFKYGGDLLYMFSKAPRRDFSASFQYDVEQLGLSPTAFSSDNILSSIFHRGPNDKLTLVRDYHLAYEHEWFPGLINTLNLQHREMFPLGSTLFILYPHSPHPDSISSIFTSEINLQTRISFQERYLTNEFYRYTISSNYPAFLISYSYGFPNTFNSDYEYHKLVLGMKHSFNVGMIGWSKYIIEAGRIWGTLPYNLLRIHDGNQTFFFDEFSSNLMNYYEFVSDQYVSAYFTHHFDGLLFNHIPLLRKLKWREVVYIKTVFGTLSDKNKNYSAFPDQLRSFNDIPYWETGAGIENILNFIRVDAIWRLNHLHDNIPVRTPSFGIFVSMNFSF